MNSILNIQELNFDFDLNNINYSSQFFLNASHQYINYSPDAISSEGFLNTIRRQNIDDCIQFYSSTNGDFFIVPLMDKKKNGLIGSLI